MAKKYAQVAVAIAGIHFKAGDEIKGVDDEEQIAICERLKKVGPKKPPKNKKAPEIKSPDLENEVNEEAELTGEIAEDIDGEDAIDDVEDQES